MPTDKRKKHMERQLKKQVNQRTMEERQKEVGDIMSRLNQTPIPKDLPCEIVQEVEIIFFG